MLGFYWGAGNLNSDPHACLTLSTGPSPPASELISECPGLDHPLTLTTIEWWSLLASGLNWKVKALCQSLLQTNVPDALPPKAGASIHQVTLGPAGHPAVD